VSSRETERGQLRVRFSLLGAVLGLGVGAYEAGYLYYTPWLPTLTEPGVSHIIWFLAPLIDLLLFTMLGLVMACLAGLRSVPSGGKQVTLGSILTGLAGVHVAWVLKLGPRRGTDVELIPGLVTTLLGFGLALALARLSTSLGGRRVPNAFEAAGRRSTTAVAWVLGVITILLVAGLGIDSSGIFAVAHPTRANSPAGAGQPNIVLISLDTVRADHLSVYGYARPTTPALERLAQQGTLFENATAPSSWTLTSHSAIFTGLLPHQHGASWLYPLDSSVRTMAEVLASLGYETAGFNANIHYGQGMWGIAQGFETYRDDSSTLRHNFAATLIGRVVAQPLYQRLIRNDLMERRNAEQLNRQVIRWLKGSPQQPFFLFVNYLDAHHPYLPPPPFDRRFGEISAAAIRGINAMKGSRTPPPLAPDLQASLVTGYDNSLAYLDDQVGRLLDVIAHSPDAANTIIIVTADHGEAFGEHGPYGHEWNLHREVVHVPLILAGPGIPEGLRISHVARTRELFPTVLDLARRGRFPLRRSSLRRFWTAAYQPTPWDDAVISELVPNTGPAGRPAYVSLLTSDWQYIHGSNGDVELYRWPTDPQEKTNLAQSPEYQQTLQELLQRVTELLSLSLPPWREPDYFSALGSPLFAHDILFSAALRTSQSSGPHRIGTSQALFTGDSSAQPRQPLPSDEELMNSLPYR
jgi:arylsulfatase A-like enzyme